jgi:hypothetical protein
MYEFQGGHFHENVIMLRNFGIFCIKLAIVEKCASQTFIYLLKKVVVPNSEVPLFLNPPLSIPITVQVINDDIQAFRPCPISLILLYLSLLPAAVSGFP